MSKKRKSSSLHKLIPDDNSNLLTINLHIDAISNFTRFQELSNSFEIEVSHNGKVLPLILDREYPTAVSAPNPAPKKDEQQNRYYHYNNNSNNSNDQSIHKIRDTSETNLNGKFKTHICPEDEFQIDECTTSNETIKLDFHYKLEIDANDKILLNSLADYPLFLVLYMYKEDGWDKHLLKSATTITLDIIKSTFKLSLENRTIDNTNPKTNSNNHSNSNNQNNSNNNQISEEERNGHKLPTRSESKTKFSLKAPPTKSIKNSASISSLSELKRYPIGYGHLHLIKLLNTETSINMNEIIYLYPDIVISDLPTPFVVIRLHSMETILSRNPGMKFVNLACITLESIFNIRQEMNNDENGAGGDRETLNLLNSSNIEVHFYLVKNCEERIRIFTFKNCELKSYGEADIFRKWDNLPARKSLGVHVQLPTRKNLNNIYTYGCPDANINEIDDNSPVLMFNSIHVMALTKEECINLEKIISEFAYHFVIEVISCEDNTSYHGCIDVSPLIYSSVKSGRFAVRLLPSEDDIEVDKQKFSHSKINFESHTMPYLYSTCDVSRISQKRISNKNFSVKDREKAGGSSKVGSTGSNKLRTDFNSINDLQATVTKVNINKISKTSVGSSPRKLEGQLQSSNKTKNSLRSKSRLTAGYESNFTNSKESYHKKKRSSKKKNKPIHTAKHPLFLVFEIILNTPLPQCSTSEENPQNMAMDLLKEATTMSNTGGSVQQNEQTELEFYTKALRNFEDEVIKLIKELPQSILQETIYGNRKVTRSAFDAPSHPNSENSYYYDKYLVSSKPYYHDDADASKKYNNLSYSTFQETEIKKKNNTESLPFDSNVSRNALNQKVDQSETSHNNFNQEAEQSGVSNNALNQKMDQSPVSPRNACETNVISRNDYRRTSWFEEMKSNLADKLLKLVASHFNVIYPTKTNEQFRDLMVVVYNKMNKKMEKIVNDYYEGKTNYIDVSYFCTTHGYVLFTAKECGECGSEFQLISNYIWREITEGAQEIEEFYLDLVIKELVNLNFTTAKDMTKKLLGISHNHYYGLLIDAYWSYTNEEKSIWIEKLINISDLHPENVEIWCLLYAQYNLDSYRPGYNHAKMKYENCFLSSRPYFWYHTEIYFETNTETENPLEYSLYIFIKIGLYKFAKLIFDQCENAVPDEKRCSLGLTFLFLERGKECLRHCFNLFKRNEKNEFILKTLEGHLLYENEEEEKAFRKYELVFHKIKNDSFFDHIAFLRCGFWHIRREQYLLGKDYFTECARKTSSFLSWYGLGICFFRLGDLKSAEIAFARSDSLFSKFADVWIYFSMINIKLGNYTKGKVCFSYSRKYDLLNKSLQEEIIELFKCNNIQIPFKF